MFNTLNIHKTTVNSARLRKRLAILLFPFLNKSNTLKVSPINIVPRKRRSYRLIWNVYGFKVYKYKPIVHSFSRLAIDYRP